MDDKTIKIPFWTDYLKDYLTLYIKQEQLKEMVQSFSDDTNIPVSSVNFESIADNIAMAGMTAVKKYIDTSIVPNLMETIKSDSETRDALQKNKLTSIFKKDGIQKLNQRIEEQKEDLKKHIDKSQYIGDFLKTNSAFTGLSKNTDEYDKFLKELGNIKFDMICQDEGKTSDFPYKRTGERAKEKYD